ncbi:MAG: SRPBCC family protein [Chloroflexota bacterium]
MDLNVGRYLGAVARAVESCERDGRPARKVVATCVYQTDAADVWDALTNADRIPRWFLPISGDLKLGGRYQLEGNAGGLITECEPMRRLAVTWEFGGGVTWLTVTLAPERAGGTRLTLEHEAVVEQHWEQYGPGAVGIGWDMTLSGLGKHLASGEPNNAAEFMAWMGTPQGKQFIKVSSDAWCEAAIAGGEGTDAARAAAERTRAAYTGEPVADSEA